MRSNEDLRLSIVIPVYNSERILPHLVNQIDTAMSANEWKFEILLVCDCSPDDSWDVILKLTDSYPSVKGLYLSANVGQHNSLMAGIERAYGNVIVTMDDDLQHNPSDISRLIEALDCGYDVAYARFISRHHPTWKLIGSKLNDKVAGFLLGKPKDLYLSPFRAFRANIKSAILKYSGPYVYVDGLILGATRKIASVDVEHYERFSGESRYGLVKSISLWLKMATNFSILPLRITSLLGIVFAVFGFLLALVFVLQKFTIDAMPDGWSALMVTILILGGVQLLALGVLGEYLGRVLLTINSKPPFIVGEEAGFGDS